MSTLVISEIDQAKKDFEENGFAILKGYLKDNPKLQDLKNKVHHLVCIKAKQYDLELPQNDADSINTTIMKLNAINDKIGAFLNDALNASPELINMLASDEICSLAARMLMTEKKCILGNNYRIRVQIPGRDEISNLPWHQDSHYNNFYKHKNSIVIWTSVNDIDDETGPVVFKKGSQDLGQIPQVEYIRPNNAKIHTVDEKYINDNSYEECAIPTESGDVLLIDMDIIHRSGYNNSKDKVKLSLQARYHNANAEGFLPHYD